MLLSLDSCPAQYENPDNSAGQGFYCYICQAISVNSRVTAQTEFLIPLFEFPLNTLRKQVGEKPRFQ